SIVAIDASGNAKALAAGTAVITAAIQGAERSTTVTVTAAALVSLTIDPALLVLGTGETASLRARGSYADGTAADLTASVSWDSSAPAVASVSNAAGSEGAIT